MQGLKECFRCLQTDGLWVECDENAAPELRYQVHCICGLAGLPESMAEEATAWWNEGEAREREAT